MQKTNKQTKNSKYAHSKCIGFYVFYHPLHFHSSVTLCVCIRCQESYTERLTVSVIVFIIIRIYTENCLIKYLYMRQMPQANDDCTCILIKKIIKKSNNTKYIENALRSPNQIFPVCPHATGCLWMRSILENHCSADYTKLFTENCSLRWKKKKENSHHTSKTVICFDTIEQRVNSISSNLF